MRTHLIIPDQHAHPDHDNRRADWLGKFIKELKPDIVVNIGDAADMPSLSSYDKGKASFINESYERDLEAHLDFQYRLWQPSIEGKKRMPYRVFLEGNHEHRIKRVLEFNQEYHGIKHGISFDHLDLDSYYNKVVPYDGQTPGTITIDDITYAHFFITGISGRPLGGEHHAYTLNTKNFSSCICGHTHTADMNIRTRADGKKLMSLVVGVYQDYDAVWAGKANDLWWRGIVVLHNVRYGVYDPMFISLDTLRQKYDTT